MVVCFLFVEINAPKSVAVGAYFRSKIPAKECGGVHILFVSFIRVGIICALQGSFELVDMIFNVSQLVAAGNSRFRSMDSDIGSHGTVEIVFSIGVAIYFEEVTATDIRIGVCDDSVLLINVDTLFMYFYLVRNLVGTSALAVPLEIDEATSGGELHAEQTTYILSQT